MNEIQKTNQGEVVVTTPTSPQVGFNFFDPIQFETMQRVCKMFSYSELVPDMYKATFENAPANADEATIKNVQLKNKMAETKAMANCMIAIEIASRIGASPLMIMQNMTPIYGKPSWSSKFLIATVNTCGRFNSLQFRFTEKGNLGVVDYVEYAWNGRTKAPITKQFDGKKIMDIECVAYTTEKGKDEILEGSPISIRMAIQEGWYTKNGSKWQTMPKQMLMYRAASFWTNAYAPELSMGMKTIEEQQDIYTPFQEVTDDVETEKKENANKEEISMGLDSDDANVDKETGEIKEAVQPKPQPKSDNKPSPGF